MDSKSKTIDDIGLDAHTRYEHDKISYDKNFEEGWESLASNLDQDILTPIKKDAISEIFDTTPNQWSLITYPKRYHMQRKRLFTHNISKSLEASKIEDYISKITNSMDGRSEKSRNDGGKLIEMLSMINIFNELLSSINSERYRYGKG